MSSFPGLLVLLLLSTGAHAALRKCCARNERFAWDSARQRFECRRYAVASTSEQTDMTADPLAWIPRDAVRLDGDDVMDRDRVNALLLSAQVEFDAQPTCAASSRDLLVHFGGSAGSEQQEFGLVLDVTSPDHVVRLEALKEASLHDPGVAHAQLFPPRAFCVDAGPDGDHLALLCPCAQLACVRKCCADAFAYNETRGACQSVSQLPYVVYDWLPGLQQPPGDNQSTADPVRYYRLTSAQPECAHKGLHVIKNKIHEEAKFNLLPDGSIQAADAGRRVYDVDRYCGEFTVRNDEAIVFCLLDGDSPDAVSLLHGSLLVASALALLATVALQAALPDMRRTVFGKVCLAHNVMLMLGFCALAAMELAGPVFSDSACAAASLLVQFSILSAFLWLNVMSFHIAWLYGGVQQQASRSGHRPLMSDARLLACYALYAWGTATLIGALTAFVELSPAVTDFKPRFGHPSCFFNDRGATWLLFYGPMTALMLVTACLAAFTLVSHLAVKHQQLANDDATHVTSRHRNADKLLLFGKLLSLMSVTWVLEIVSWAVDGDRTHWLLADVINLLRGVAIFVIFCCNRRTLVLLRRAFARHSAPLGSGSANLGNSKLVGFSRSRLELQDLADEE